MPRGCENIRPGFMFASERNNLRRRRIMRSSLPPVLCLLRQMAVFCLGALILQMTPDQTVLLLDLMLACGAAYLAWLCSL